jgi:hypothetical protein
MTAMVLNIVVRRGRLNRPAQTADVSCCSVHTATAYNRLDESLCRTKRCSEAHTGHESSFRPVREAAEMTRMRLP